ncbi:MAG: hypothetical protein WDW38_008698 [Sanguina aurantia]
MKGQGVASGGLARNPGVWVSLCGESSGTGRPGAPPQQPSAPPPALPHGNSSRGCGIGSRVRNVSWRGVGEELAMSPPPDSQILETLNQSVALTMTRRGSASLTHPSPLSHATLHADSKSVQQPLLQPSNGGAGVQPPQPLVLADTSVVLWSDELFSMEERRAMLPKYARSAPNMQNGNAPPVY